MKGKMRKLFALALAAIMVLAMGITASAQTVGAKTDGTATITINNASKGETYKVYKIFDATYNETTGTIAYTYNGKLSENPYFEQNPTTGAITAKVETLGDEAIAWLKTLASEDHQVKFTGDDTNEGGIVSDGSSLTINGLAYGYYVITSSLNGGAAIAVNSTNPEATMNDKNNSTPNWKPDEGKVSDKDSAAFGETVKFTLNINAQNYVEENGTAKQIKNYVVKDNLAEGKFTNIQVTKVAVTGPEADATPTTLAEGTDYTLNTESGNFPINVIWATGNAENGYASKYRSGSTLSIEYTAVLNDNSATMAGDGNKNEASFSWVYTDDSEGGKDGSEDTNTTSKTVYTFALAINKIDPKGTALAGAEFTVKDAEGNLIKVSGTDGKYKVTTADDGVTTVKSGTNGLIVIKGVAEGTYTIEETKAPDGYNLLGETKTISASIDSRTDYTETVTIYKDAEGNVVEMEVTGGSSTTVQAEVPVTAINVVNNAGTLLPSTGGIGTTIFYVVGGILVAAAGVLLITKKRMSKEQ